MSWLDKLHEAQAELAARNADPWRLPLERCKVKSATMASSGLRRRWCSTSLKFLNVVEEPGRAVVWRS